jgi:hypothetical protein
MSKEQLHLNPDRVYNDATGWLKDGDTYSPIPAFAKTLAPGIYFIQVLKGALAFTKTVIPSDKIFEIKGSVQEKILSNLDSFWSKEDEYKRAGIIYKRGLIIHGGPGCGKTVLVGQICDHLIEKNGIALVATEPNLTIEAASQLRKIEPNRKLIVLYEDFEGYLAGFGEENLLSLFDGQRQLNNIVHICTTNYLEDIPDRFKKRPSRIDEVIEIEPPTEDARRLFLSKLHEAHGRDFREVQERDWLGDTADMPFAHIKELFISVVVLGYDYETTLARLQSYLTESDSDNSGVFGKDEG